MMGERSIGECFERFLSSRTFLLFINTPELALLLNPPDNCHQHYNIELSRTYWHNPGQSKAELYNMEWYYYRKTAPYDVVSLARLVAFKALKLFGQFVRF